MKKKNANGFFSDQIPGSLAGSLETYACQLSITLHGVPVQTMGYPMVRTQSTIFPLVFPSLGVEDPETIDDGYYVAIPSPGRGDHIIHFTGGICYFDQSPRDNADDDNLVFWST
jgi:hypothetical protein